MGFNVDKVRKFSQYTLKENFWAYLLIVIAEIHVSLSWVTTVQ